jgi:tetratricopeptide (TPR) repeat protein
MTTQCLEGLQDRTRQIEVKRLKAEARVAEAEARELLARRARRLAAMLAVAGVIVAAMLAAGLGWYANDRLVRDADESRRRVAALQQIDEALDEAEARLAEANDSAGGPLVRDAAARQALSACHRAEALLAATPHPPDDFRQRFDALKPRVAETERGTRLTVAIEQWRASLFDSRGRFDGVAASASGREILASHGLESLTDAAVVAGIRAHPARNSLREFLTDWFVVTADQEERRALATILQAVDDNASPGWMKVVFNNDLDNLARLADVPLDVPLSPVTMAVSARRLIDAGRAAEAERLLVRGVRRFPNDFTLSTQLGAILRARPDSRSEAIRYLTAARAARPGDAIANHELGIALADAGRADEALELLRAAVKADSTLTTAHTRIGDLLFAQGDSDGARASYAAAVAIEPDNAAAQLGIGQIELIHGNLEAAEKALRNSNSIAPTPAAFAGIGRIHLKRWEASKAKDAFRAATEMAPTNIEYRLGLIDSLRMANDPDGAIREARETIRIAPASAPAHRVLGELLRLTGDKLAAVQAYRAAARHDPTDVDTHLRLAVLCESIDDAAGAADAYRAAAELRLKDHKLQLTAARALARAGNQLAAIEVCRRMLARDPNDAASRHYLGRLLIDRMDEAAIEEFRLAAKADPSSGDIRVELGEALLRFGKFRDAASAFREAAERFPENSPKRLSARQNVWTAQRWAGLERRLPEILSGEVGASSPRAWADFGEVCRRTGHYAAAARFFANAAKGDIQFARHAAVCAALAGFGRGLDANQLSESEQNELRRSALQALRRSPSWSSEPELTAIKSQAAIDSLSTEERESWRQVLSRK